MNDDTTGSRDGVRHRGWQLAVAVAAVLAVAFGVWFVAGEVPRSAGPPPETATASAPASSSATSADWSRQPTAKVHVTIDLDTLKRGPDPRLPWYANGVIHDGSQVTPVRHGMGDWQHESVGFSAADGAYAVSVSHPEGGGSWRALIDRRGNVLEDADIQAVSADGSLVAWTERVSKSRSKVPVVRDLKTGKTTRGKARAMAGLDGFVGDKLLYTTEVRGGYAEGTAIWDPGTDSDQQVSPDVSGVHLLTDDIALAQVRQLDREGWCLDLYNVKEREPPRKPCGGGSFETVRNGPYFVWNQRGRSVVVDARTGQGVLRISSRNEQISYLSLEPGGALLVKLTGPVESDLGGDEGRTAIVRCSLAGECERASEIYEPKPGTSRSLIELPL